MPQELAWLWFTFQTSTLTFLLLIGRFGSTAESMRSENIRSHLRTTRSRRNNNIYMFDDVAGFFQLCTCQCYTWKYQMKDSLSRDNLWFACTRLSNASRIHMNVWFTFQTSTATFLQPLIGRFTSVEILQSQQIRSHCKLNKQRYAYAWRLSASHLPMLHRKDTKWLVGYVIIIYDSNVTSV